MPEAKQLEVAQVVCATLGEWLDVVNICAWIITALGSGIE
jgi:hypothetical protein